MPRYKVTGLLARIETVEGTDATPTAAADGIQLEEHLWNQIETGYLEANARDNVAGRGLGVYGDGQPTGAYAKVTAVAALKGRGAAYAAASRPELDVLHRIAALQPTVTATAGAETIVYTPRADEAFESATVYAYAAGLLFKLVGCRAKITSISYTAARIALVTYEIWGRLSAMPTEAALPAITYASRTVKPPVLQGGALTLNGFGASFRSLTFDEGLELATKPRGNAAGGHAGYEVASLSPQLRAQIDRPSLAAFNPWALRDTATLFAWSLTLGSTQYNRIELLGPAGQIMEIPQEESDGLAMVTLRVRCNSTDVAAGFSIRYH